MLRAAVGGRLVVVTGATRGFGRALSLALARSGARLILLGRGDATAGLRGTRADDLDSIAERCDDLGAEVQTIALDLRDLDGVDLAARQLLARRGVPDVVVCCASSAVREHPFEASPSARTLDEAFATHLAGHAALIQPWLPRMQAGSIIASAALLPKPATAAGAARAALAARDSWFSDLGAAAHPRGISAWHLQLTRDDPIDAARRVANRIIRAAHARDAQRGAAADVLDSLWRRARAAQTQQQGGAKRPWA